MKASNSAPSHPFPAICHYQYAFKPEFHTLAACPGLVSTPRDGLINQTRSFFSAREIKNARARTHTVRATNDGRSTLMNNCAPAEMIVAFSLVRERASSLIDAGSKSACLGGRGSVEKSFQRRRSHRISDSLGRYIARERDAIEHEPH